MQYSPSSDTKRKPRKEVGDAMLGRHKQVAIADDALERLGRRQGGALTVTGEPGIGKTRLAQELCARAVARGHLVVAGDGFPSNREVESSRPISPHDDPVAELTSLLAALATRDPGPAVGEPVERYRVHAAIRALVERLARDRPLVLVFDGLQCPDQATLEVVAHLLRRPIEASLLLVLTYRRRKLSPTFASAVATAAREGYAGSIELPPLDEPDARRVLGNGLDPVTCSAILRDSEGNPLYLRELARHARQFGRGTAGRSRWRAELPSSVKQAIADEVGVASPHAHAVLRAAALTDGQFDRQLVARVAEVDASVALEALDELFALDLVRVEAEPGQMRLRHPIVRRAVYEATEAGWLRGAHARAARVLSLRGVPAAMRADHVAGEASPGREDAARVLLEAGRDSVWLAPASAASWLARALCLLPEEGSAAERVEAQVQLALSLGATGRVEEGRAALAEVAEAAAQDAAPARAAMRLNHMLGRHGSPLELADDSSAGVELRLDHWLAGRWDELEARAAVLPQDADPGQRAHSAALQALVELHRGAISRAAEITDDATEIVNHASDRALSTRIDALVGIAMAELGLERYSSAEDHLARGVMLCRATGQDVWLSHLGGLLAHASLWCGQLQEASNHIDLALQSTMREQALPLVWGLTQRCRLAHIRGNLAYARRVGELALAVRRRVPKAPLPWHPGCTLAAVRIDLGEPDSGRELILRETGGEGLDAIEPSWRAHWYGVLAQSELAGGRIDAAALWAQRAEDWELGLAGAVGDARRARAAVSLAIGESTEAAQLALEAARRFDGIGRRIDAARARVLAGQALFQAGRLEGAAAELQAAQSELASCGASLHRKEAAHELRRVQRALDHESRTGGREGEHELSQLVADGLTNRQIGDRLFVSEKTIERRLTRLFRQLGVSSRVELAATVRAKRELSLPCRVS